MVEIYALKHPETGEVRYVGKANDAAKRLKSHLRDARRRDTPVYRWIRKLSDSGLAPVVEVLHRCEPAEWPDVERATIARMKADGVRLLNVAEGGDEPFCPPDVRAENGRRNAAARAADPTKRRIWELKRAIGSSLRWLDQHGSDEAKARIKGKLRLAAQLRPDLFGEWASL